MEWKQASFETSQGVAPASIACLLAGSLKLAPSHCAVHQPAALLVAGAIFGLGGALAVYCARHRELMGTQSDAILRSLGQSLALNIAIGFSTPQIDQW